MSLSAKATRFWEKHRRALVFLSVCGWALFIVVTYRRSQSGPRTIKGAGELLEIGALPVT